MPESIKSGLQAPLSETPPAATRGFYRNGKPMLFPKRPRQVVGAVVGWDDDADRAQCVKPI